MRYRAEVTIISAYFVDANSPEQASAKAIALAKAGIRPVYDMGTTADVDVCAETVAA